MARMILVKYNHNNSGGSDWLEDADWYALERAGWAVDWIKNSISELHKRGELFRGPLAISASKKFSSVEAAKVEFMRITGEDSEAEGCSCCGPPHAFRTVK